ncbi:hypothetical protein K7X08_033882 [Anisodus acutangulus]|uniref:Uncharacterized protein n=1 Tax=Anisodus acutangulus TaxID=402998 RepID=A0A9Q1M624_9SOLA|nr:hypothetical protein K7X08_033882 [Anisodus acutangulus]
MKGVVRALLDLPVEIKKRNKDNVIPGTGYFPLSPQNPIVEALGLYDMSSADDIHAFCSQLDASPYHRETIKKCAAGIHELLLDIARKICEGLGLASNSFEEWPCLFRFNKYSFTLEAVGSTAALLQTHFFSLYYKMMKMLVVLKS